MAAKIPVRAVFDGSTATGLSEFQSTEFIALAYGGLGASLSIGSAGQVLKVNAGADALEFGAVEAVLNIDGMTDGSGITIADGDKFAISDGGTEKYVLASQIKSYVVGAGATDITALDIDGATDIGAAIASGDLFIIDDGAGGTNRKTAASRIKTFVADVTLTTAAQSNITSLGTLTTLTVDNIIVNGTNIGHTSDTDAIAIASDGKVTFTQEVIAPSLDISGDVDVDGTLETDALTIGGITLAETIADTVGAMVTSNTETDIAVTYEDGDNTLDFVIGTLNQDTSGTAAIATTVTITDNESTDEDNALIFTAGGDVDGGNLGLESDGTLTYNPSTGKVTATGFVGTLTGNVTGDVSGTASTVTGAAQSSITSVGTLTSVVIADAGNIGSASDTDAIAIASNGVVTFSQNPVFPDGGVSIDDLDIDGGTDIGDAIADADLFIIDDGAGGTNRKTAASRLKTYINVADEATALAIALG